MTVFLWFNKRYLFNIGNGITDSKIGSSKLVAVDLQVFTMCASVRVCV